ncbi:MAG: YitT family protein [Oscillospiraceae bacterium]|nr:YitT family protein [Oscillospiraceae bacterium]
MVKSAMKSGWGRLSIAVAGALIYALGINLFVAPLGLFTGGLMGLCQLLRSLILMVLGIDSLPFELAGILLYAFNVPLLILAYRSMGKVFFRNTLICSTAYAVFASIVPVPPAPIVEDMLTGCLLGGVISGVGSGLALTSGCCGGGLDLLGLYLAKKGAKVTIGRFNLAFNAVLFITCGVLFDLTTLIYSVLNTIFNAMAIDRAHRQSVTVQVLIFTKEDRPELGRFIMDNLHRGITRWEGKGVYTGEATHILCVCMNKYEIDDLREALTQIDPKAFFIVQEGVHVSRNFERRLS